MNKKKLPLRRKDRTATEQLNSQDENPVLKTKIKLDGGINEMNPIQNFEIPEFLKKGDNEQNFQSFLRMRQRHIQDGAISINIEADDIADQNIELYENKVINLELPNMNENLAKNKEYYVENTNRNQFHKISKIADEITKIENKPNQKKKVEKYKTGYHKEIERTTEDQIFSLFDEKLTEIILMTSNKVALLFLFTQGLLAGVSLIHILLLFQYENFQNFLSIYSYHVREIFNFTHALTFSSLVGNGIKFLSAYKRLFTLIFAIEMYLASFIPAIFYSKFTSVELISISEFQVYAVLYIICNMIAIINFILNIFDVRIEDSNQNEINNIIGDNIAIEEEYEININLIKKFSETRDNTIDSAL